MLSSYIWRTQQKQENESSQQHPCLSFSHSDEKIFAEETFCNTSATMLSRSTGPNINNARNQITEKTTLVTFS